MLLPDEIDQTIDQITEALEELPRIVDHRGILNGQHEHIPHEKQTDVLPSLTLDTSGATVTWWQARQFREDNENLRPLLEQQRAEMQMLIAEYNNLKGGIRQRNSKYPSQPPAGDSTLPATSPGRRCRTQSFA